MDSTDLQRLELAVEWLENPTWTARLTDLIGGPVDWAVARLPAEVHELYEEIAARLGFRGPQPRLPSPEEPPLR